MISGGEGGGRERDFLVIPIRVTKILLQVLNRYQIDIPFPSHLYYTIPHKNSEFFFRFFFLLPHVTCSQLNVALLFKF